MKTQTDEIREHLERYGSIEPLEALSKYGCYRLSARINQLRNDGLHIVTEMQTSNNGRTYAMYRLIKKGEEQLSLL